mmetsp:Transcript_42076/g.125961  ORF Transcript_42076/g.125961 Transcript_42076/m.125961 type:complete len:260 (-) Transcript_42076:2457-3236(-)
MATGSARESSRDRPRGNLEPDSLDKASYPRFLADLGTSLKGCWAPEEDAALGVLLSAPRWRRLDATTGPTLYSKGSTAGQATGGFGWKGSCLQLQHLESGCSEWLFRAIASRDGILGVCMQLAGGRGMVGLGVSWSAGGIRHDSTARFRRAANEPCRRMRPLRTAAMCLSSHTPSGTQTFRRQPSNIVRNLHLPLLSTKRKVNCVAVLVSYIGNVRCRESSGDDFGRCCRTRSVRSIYDSRQLDNCSGIKASRDGIPHH